MARTHGILATLQPTANFSSMMPRTTAVESSRIKFHIFLKFGFAENSRQRRFSSGVHPAESSHLRVARGFCDSIEEMQDTANFSLVWPCPDSDAYKFLVRSARPRVDERRPLLFQSSAFSLAIMSRKKRQIWPFSYFEYLWVFCSS